MHRIHGSRPTPAHLRALTQAYNRNFAYHQHIGAKYPTPTRGATGISKSVPDLSALSLHIQFLEVILFHALSTSTSAWHKALLKVQESRSSIDDIVRILDKRLHARAYVHLQEYQRTTEVSSGISV